MSHDDDDEMSPQQQKYAISNSKFPVHLHFIYFMACSCSLLWMWYCTIHFCLFQCMDELSWETTSLIYLVCQGIFSLVHFSSRQHHHQHRRLRLLVTLFAVSLPACLSCLLPWNKVRFALPCCYWKGTSCIHTTYTVFTVDKIWRILIHKAILLNSR